MKVIQKIAPCLWFDDQAEEAVRFRSKSTTSRRRKWTKSQRAMQAMLGMKKIVIEDLKRAYAG